MRQCWSREDEKLLKKLIPYYRQGLISMEELTKIFGRSYGSIASKALRLGLKLTTTKSTVNWEFLQELVKRRKIKI